MSWRGRIGEATLLAGLLGACAPDDAKPPSGETELAQSEEELAREIMGMAGQAIHNRQPDAGKDMQSVQTQERTLKERFSSAPESVQDAVLGRLRVVISLRESSPGFPDSPCFSDHEEMKAVVGELEAQYKGRRPAAGQGR